MQIGENSEKGGSIDRVTGSVGVGIVTLNAAKEISKLLTALRREPGWNFILVVDSSSTDGTVEIIREYPEVKVIVIPRCEFNHGATREMIRQTLKCDVVVFLTQDVIPEQGFLVPLVTPIVTGDVAVTYGRQLPHAGADFFESFPREFNYPDQSQIRSLKHARQYGVYTFFCSDSCAAYSNVALDGIGGFKAVLTNEDYFAVAHLLQAGHKIMYVAEAQVRHSHRYTLWAEFQRYFDTGYVRAENPWVAKLVGQAEGRGAIFAKQMFKRLSRRAPYLIPYALVQTVVKWLGFRIGFIAIHLPTSWCRFLSSQRYFWRSRYCVRAVNEGSRRNTDILPTRGGQE